MCIYIYIHIYVHDLQLVAAALFAPAASAIQKLLPTHWSPYGRRQDGKACICMYVCMYRSGSPPRATHVTLNF